MQKHLKSQWKRIGPCLIALVMAVGMLPVTGLAAEPSLEGSATEAETPYAPTGSFELSVAGTTAWNGGDGSLAVYATETGTAQAASIPIGEPFALLEDSGGNRLKIGYSESGWTGSTLEDTGWADKDSILVNLPDLIPSIVYVRQDGEPQFNSRLTRFEYVIPCPYGEAERLAQLQAEALAGGETLVVCMDGQTVTVSRATGDPASLETYSLDGVAYQKYSQWTEIDPAENGTSSVSAYQLPYTVSAAYSADPSITLGMFAPQPSRPSRAPAANSSPTGGVGAYNPGSPGGQKPHTSNVAWAIDPERTFLRFTLIEFPQGVVTDLNTQDWNTWHVVGTPLNVVWSNGWSAEQCRSDITWYNSCAVQYNAVGANAPSLMAGSSVNQGVYSYDATLGYNQRWVTTADEFQAESGITDQQKEQMFHLNSDSWSTTWLNGDYTSLWGTDAQSVAPGNLYQVYQANDAFLYLLGRLTETDNGSGGSNPGWSKDEAMEKWSEYITDPDGNLRTKYRIIVETGMVVKDPDGGRRGFTLRDTMAYSLYNNEPQERYNLIWDQMSTIVNMSQWMRQAKQQFLEYPLDENGTPTGEELVSTNGFTECDSYVDTIQYARPIRDTIFSERRSFGLHIFSPFNFEHDPPGEPDEPDTPDPGEPDDPDEPDIPEAPASGKAILFKRDANTNEGVGPATFKFSSVTNGDYEFDTDENGVLESIQWWDPTEAEGKYIKPGEYTVTELIPPPNYMPSNEVQQIKLELDENGDPIPAGPLVFQNLEKVGLQVVKYDRESHTPMSGVTFEIFRDGTSIGRYETDSNGEILLTGIEPGTYRAVEVDTGDESHLLDGSYQEVELVAGGGVKPLIFFNDTMPGLKLLKVDSTDMDKAVPGAVFEIEAVDGNYGPQQFTTDANGEIDLSDLPTGSYVVTELACDGYVIDDAQRIIHLRANDTAEFVFTNTPKPGFKLIKTSADGSSLAGVTFRIARIEDGSRYLDRTTDENGEILVTDLEPGIYSVTETATLPDHILDTTEYHVELSPGKTAELRLTNDKRPSLTIHKSDADTGTPVAGAVFTVKAADDSTINEVTTGPDGTATLENLLPVVYEVIEKSVPEPYLLDAPSQLITLQPNWDSDIYFENHKKPTLTIQKVDSITGNPIEGAKFQIWYGSNSTTTGELNDLGTHFTDERGEIVLEGLRDGWYKVTELEPAHGFTIKEPATQEVYIEGGESKSLTFENVPLNAIVVHKTDSVTGEALAGATFQLRYLGGASGTGGTVIGQKVTGQNGTAIWTGLEPGTYILEEVDPADGYSIIQSSETVYLADSGEQSVITVRFENMPDGVLLIRKVCATNPSVTLPNAEFKVTYADGTLIGDSNGIFRTDENGEIRIEGLDPGKSVVVTETQAPPGFIIDTQAQTVQIKAGRTVSLTFKNQPKGELIIQKRDSATGQPLAGAEFRVTTAAGCEVGLDGVIGDSTLTQNGIFTTDSNGEIRITNLAPGAYVLTEIKAPAGYVMDTPSTNVVIGEGGDTQTVVITNSKAGSLIIDKRDSLTGEPLEGVTFKVTTSTGEFVPDENGHISSNGIYKTDKDGKIQINGVVGTLVVTEVEAILGYTIDPAHQTQTVQVNPNDTQTIYFTNTPSTTLVIEKYIEGTTTPLEGVTFLVTNSSGAMVGPSNGEYITDENGRIVIDGLEPGITVTAREVKTLDGYVLDGAPKSIEIKAGEVQTLRFYNETKGTLVIRKLDSVTKAPLSGVEFELTYADGGYVDNANGHLSSLGLYTTDANGEIRISGITGIIVVKETKTIEGYTIDEATRIQTVQVNPEDTQTITVYNDPLGGVEIIKVNADDTKERIPNVTFEIRKIDDELIDTITTDKNGRAFLSLEDGAYYAVEIEAAEGFNLDDTPYYFEVEDGKTTPLRVANKAFSGIIIHKIDSVTGEGIYDVKFLLYDANKNPIGEYTTDQNGYIYIDEALAEGRGRFYIRELEAAEGYELDEEYKTVYVQPGKTIEIEWENVPITGQIQIYKYSAEANSVTGAPAGTPLQGAVYEIIHERSGRVVDYITTDARGVAASNPLPLTRYKIREVTAPAYYQLDPTVHDVTLEYSGQIIKLSAYDKAANLKVTVTKVGNKQLLAGDSLRYDLTVSNNSNVALENFYLHDRFPTDCSTVKTVTTGTYNTRLNYQITYKTNYNDYRVLATNLLSTNIYAFDLAAVPLMQGEVITDVRLEFGKVPAGFASVVKPTVTIQTSGTLANGYQVVNRADAGGQYMSQWETGRTAWITLIIRLNQPNLPKTGY